MRKFIISLKRRPHNIPLVMLSVCCIIYTFQLSAHSNAAMYVNSKIIALYVFIITLASMLNIFSFMNAFSNSRQAVKRKKLMLAIVYALIGVQLLLDGVYLDIMFNETMRRENPVPITPFIASSVNWTFIHLGALAFTLLLIIFLPFYHKLILKIDTTIEDDELSGIIEEKLVEDEEEF